MTNTTIMGKLIIGKGDNATLESSGATSVLGINADGEIVKTNLSVDANTFDNGLTELSGAVILGGSLTQLTDIAIETGTDLTITDNRTTPTGIEYSADYSSAFTANSLVSKTYVDDIVSNTKFIDDTTVIGDDSTSAFTITHGKGTNAVIVQVIDNAIASDSFGETVEVLVDRTSTNDVEISFSTPPATGEDYLVVII